MTKNEDLKACPFCETGRIVKSSPFYVHLNRLEPCPLNGVSWNEDSENFKAWNTRPTVTPLNLSDECISECRKHFKEHVGIEAAFFDDCVLLACKEILNLRDKVNKDLITPTDESINCVYIGNIPHLCGAGKISEPVMIAEYAVAPTDSAMEDAAQREPADSVCADSECPATSSTTDRDAERALEALNRLNNYFQIERLEDVQNTKDMAAIRTALQSTRKQKG